MFAKEGGAFFAASSGDDGPRLDPSSGRDAPQADTAPEHPSGGDALGHDCRAVSEAASAEVGDIIVDLLALASRHPEYWSQHGSHELLILARRLSLVLSGTVLADGSARPDRQDLPPLHGTFTSESKCEMECKDEERAETGQSTRVRRIKYSRRTVGEALFPRFPWHVAAKLDALIDAICISFAAASAFIFFLPWPLRYQAYHVCTGLCSINVPHVFWIVAQFSLQTLREMVCCFESWFLLANMMVWITFALLEEYQRQTKLHNFLHACIAYLHVGAWAVPLAFIDAVPDKKVAKLVFCLTWCFVVVSVFFARLLSPPNWHGQTITSISLSGSGYEFGTGPLIRAALVNLAIFTGKFAYREIFCRNAVVLRQPVRITWVQAPVLESSLGSDKVVPYVW